MKRWYRLLVCRLVDGERERHALRCTAESTGGSIHDLVHAVTGAAFDALGEFRRLHPSLLHPTVAEMLETSALAPLHAGAIHHYAERGRTTR